MANVVHRSLLVYTRDSFDFLAELHKQNNKIPEITNIVEGRTKKVRSFTVLPSGNKDGYNKSMQQIEKIIKSIREYNAQSKDKKTYFIFVDHYPDGRVLVDSV